jgi:hypothetical protein
MVKNEKQSERHALIGKLGSQCPIFKNGILLPKLFSNPSRQILNMTIFSQIMDSLVD